MPGIHIDFTSDNSNIVSMFDETNTKMKQLSRYIERLNREGLDMSSSNESLKSLRTHISDLEGKISDYQAKLQKLFEDQKKAMSTGDTDAVVKYGVEIESVSRQVGILSNELEVAEEAIGTLTQNMEKSNSSLEKNDGIMVKLLGGQEKYNSIVSMLPPKLQSAVKGLNGMVGAAKAFIATPLGAILAALILAFKAVSTWMTKSAEGQKVLAKISGTLSGVLAGLQQIVMNVGKALYNAFTNPKEAAKNFVDFLKSQVANRVQAIGEMFGSVGRIIGNVFKGNFDEAKDALKDLGKAYVKFGTGIEPEKIGNAFKEVGNIAKATAELEERSTNLRIARMKWQTEEAQLRKQIAEASNAMMVGTDSERVAAAARMQSLQNKLTAKQVEFAREEYEIKKAKNALTTSSLEDLEEEARLQAEVTRLETEGITAKRRAQRIEYSSGRKETADAERRLKAEETLQNELNDLVLSNESARVDLMEDGGKKQLAVIESNYQKQIEAIRKQKAKWQSENKVAYGTEDLRAEQTAALNQAEIIAEKQRSKAINEIHEQSYKEFVKAYGDRKQQELLLTDEYHKALEAADKEDFFARKKIREDYMKAMQELDDKYSASYALIFADASLLSDNLLAKAIEETEKRINKAKDSGDIQALTKLYERLREQMAEQSARSEWGFEGIASGLKDLAAAKKALKDAKDGFETDEALKNQQAAYDKIKRAVNEVATAFRGLGSILSEFDGVLGGIGSMFSGLASHASDFEKILTGTVTKGDVISSVFSFAVDTASMIASSIKENKKAQEEWNNTIRQTAHEFTMLQLDALDYKQQNIFGVENPYKRAIDGALQYGKAMEELNKLTADLYNGQVQTGTKKVIDWSNVGQGAAGGAAAGALAGSIIPGLGTVIGAAIGAIVGGAAGAAAKKTVPVFESLLSQYDWLYDDETYELNPRIIADYEKLDDTTKEIVNNWQDIADKAKAAEDQMRQNFADLAGDMGSKLSDSLVEAFRNGNLYSAIDDFHKKMSSTIEDIISQMVFSTIFSDMFDDLEKSMMASFGAGGDNNIVDDIMDFMDNYQNGIAAYDEAMRQAQLAAKERGWDLFQPDKDQTSTATAGGFQTMSQDTASELNGRFTALQISNENILQNVIAGVEHMLAVRDIALIGKNTLSEIRDAHMLEVGYLEDIAKYTKPILDLGEKLDKIDKNTSKL